jgi:hypothetical protein
MVWFGGYNFWMLNVLTMLEKKQYLLIFAGFQNNQQWAAHLVKFGCREVLIKSLQVNEKYHRILTKVAHDK